MMKREKRKRGIKEAFSVAVVLVGLAMPMASQADPEGTADDFQTGLAPITPGSQEGTSSRPDTLRPPEAYCLKGSRFWRTTLEIVGFNAVMTLYGRYIMNPEDKGFSVSGKTIKENLIAGFEWDDNSFSANNFRHPYQGGLYYNSARANGYDFYESSMFAFGGSWLFEYAGEAHHPSINDWINTAVGGITLGEVLWRLSSMVLDNTATGSGRAWRELGGAVVSPTRGLNRLLTGEAFGIHANPTNRFPDHGGGNLKIGLRTIGEEELWNSNSSRVFVAFDATYGNPFEVTRGMPFDYFTFGMQINFANRPHGLGRMESQGLLYAGDTHKTESTHHILGSFLHFDYLDNEAYTYGGQAVGASYISKFRSTENFHAITFLHLNGIILGAAKSDYFSISGREYDYGPGAGYKLGALFRLRKWDFMTLMHEGFWIHSVNGNKADHYVNLTRVKVDFPIKSFFGAGIDYVLYIADRDYEEFPDVHARNPELRAYLLWNLH
jgi:hypothetical protein